MAQKTKVSKEMTEKTQRLWNEKYGLNLTELEATEMIDRISVVFTLLDDWFTKSEVHASEDKDVECDPSDDIQGPKRQSITGGKPCQI